MKQHLILVGAGGFGREVWHYAEEMIAAGKLDTPLLGFLDENPQALLGFEHPASVLGAPSTWVVQPNQTFLVAIGDAGIRRKVTRLLQPKGARFVSLIHPTAYVAPSAKIGLGSVLCPFSFVGAYAELEESVALNAYASCGHDVKVGRFSVLSPYATINGNVVLGEACFLGTHSTVIPGKRVGQGAKVSAGAVVTRSVSAYSLAAGNPAIAREMFRPPAEAEV